MNGKLQNYGIREFETLGTSSFAIEKAIGEAINFQNDIGTEIKTKTYSLPEELLGRAVNSLK